MNLCSTRDAKSILNGTDAKLVPPKISTNFGFLRRSSGWFFGGSIYGGAFFSSLVDTYSLHAGGRWATEQHSGEILKIFLFLLFLLMPCCVGCSANDDYDDSKKEKEKKDQKSFFWWLLSTKFWLQWEEWSEVKCRILLRFSFTFTN